MADSRTGFRAAAFDLDGTLIDTMPDLAAAVNRMLSMLDAPRLPETRVRALIGHGIEQLVSSALNESLGEASVHDVQRSAAMALFRRSYSQELFSRSRVYPGVVQTLRLLSKAGISLCCITNKASVFAGPLLEAAGLQEHLAFTLCADRAEDRKPSPALLLAACSRLCITPSAMLYIGDSRIDITAARAAGCRMVAVSYGYDRSLAQADPGPDRRIDSFPELLDFVLEPGDNLASRTRRSTGAAS